MKTNQPAITICRYPKVMPNSGKRSPNFRETEKTDRWIPSDNATMAEFAHHFGTTTDGCRRLLGLHVWYCGLPAPSLPNLISHFGATRVGLIIVQVDCSPPAIFWLPLCTVVQHDCHRHFFSSFFPGVFSVLRGIFFSI